MLDQDPFYYAVPTIVFHWLGLHLLTHHRRGTPTWWGGMASVGAGGYMLTWALRLYASDLGTMVLISRWGAVPTVVQVVAAYVLAFRVRYPHRPLPRRLLPALVVSGSLVCLLVMLSPHFFDVRSTGPFNLRAGPLYPLWTAYVLGMVGALLYHLARAAMEQPDAKRKRVAWRRFAAIFIIAVAGVGDNLATYGRLAWLFGIAEVVYVPGLVLFVYWIVSVPRFFPRLRVISYDFMRSAINTIIAVVGTWFMLWLGYTLSGAAPVPAVYLLGMYWIVLVVMLTPLWERAVDMPHYREKNTLRRQLRAILHQEDTPSPLTEQLNSLLVSLAYALDTDEVCLVRVSQETIHFMAHYNAFRDSSPLTEVMVTYPDPVRWPERMSREGGMAIPIPDHDSIWLLVDMPALEMGYSAEERSLVQEVAAQIGVVLSTPATSGHSHDEPWLLLQDVSARKILRQALRNLHDPVSLGRTPLGRRCSGETDWKRGECLRERLLLGIEAQRPDDDWENEAIWRRYRALRMRYVKGLSVEEVGKQLHISKRQCQRELRAALESLGEWLVYSAE